MVENYETAQGADDLVEAEMDHSGDRGGSTEEDSANSAEMEVLADEVVESQEAGNGSIVEMEAADVP